MMMLVTCCWYVWCLGFWKSFPGGCLELVGHPCTRAQVDRVICRRLSRGSQTSPNAPSFLTKQHKQGMFFNAVIVCWCWIGSWCRNGSFLVWWHFWGLGWRVAGKKRIHHCWLKGCSEARRGKEPVAEIFSSSLLQNWSQVNNCPHWARFVPNSRLKLVQICPQLLQPTGSSYLKS